MPWSVEGACSLGIFPYGYIAVNPRLMKRDTRDVPDGEYPQGARPRSYSVSLVGYVPWRSSRMKPTNARIAIYPKESIP